MTAPSQSRTLAAIALVGLLMLATHRLFRRDPPPAHVHFPRPQGLLPDGQIEINLADTLAWQTIKGVGSSRAKLVVRRRERRGYFESPENLCEIRGIDSIYEAKPEKFVVLDSVLKVFKDSLGDPKPYRPHKPKRKKESPAAAENFAEKNEAPRPLKKTVPVPVAALDLNTANEAELEALPGIGEVLSARIVKFRNLLGGFYAVEQLREVYGLRDEHYQKCARHLVVKTPPFRKISVNSASASTLKKHPYFKTFADSMIASRPLTPEKMRALMKKDYQRAEAYIDWR